MMDGSTGGMFFGGGFMWIFWLLLIVLIVVGIKGFVGGGDRDTSSSSDSPIDILKKRYANGEINEEEFERRSKELGH